MNENEFLQHKLWQIKAIIFISGDIEQSNADVFFNMYSIRKWNWESWANTGSINLHVSEKQELPGKSQNKPRDILHHYINQS